MNGTDLAAHPIHLGPRADAGVEPAFTGDPAWFEAYTDRHAAEGADVRLVMQFSFDESWANWEVHPNGHEVVLCLSGEMLLHQEHPDGARAQVTLQAGQYAINDPGVWHTVDISGPTTGLFITAGLGTQHRPR